MGGGAASQSNRASDRRSSCAKQANVAQQRGGVASQWPDGRIPIRLEHSTHFLERRLRLQRLVLGVHVVDGRLETHLCSHTANGNGNRDQAMTHNSAIRAKCDQTVHEASRHSKGEHTQRTASHAVAAATERQTRARQRQSESATEPESGLQ
jgi:hypothetical protein